MLNRIFNFLVFVVSLNVAFTQSNFSESFFYAPKNIHLYVPSNACIENDLQGDFAYKTYIGKLSIIRTSYADLNMNLQRKRNSDSTNRHILGLCFYNDREGDLFNKTRVIVRYAVHIPLQKKLFLSVGSAFHLVNYNFHASGTGASGSDITWAGSVSSTLHSPSFKLSISFNDFNNPKVTPINYDFSIYRYITLYGEKSYDLNENIQVKGSGRYNLIFGNTYSCLLQLGFVFSKIAGINSFYYVNKGWGFAFDVNRIKLYKSHLDFSLAYLIPQRQVFPSVNQYELNLRYYIHKDNQ